MKTIKPYLFVLAMIATLSSYSQSSITIDGISYTRNKNALYNDVFRVGEQFNIPTFLKPTAPFASIAGFNNKPYFRKMVDGVMVWVPLLDSASFIPSDMADVYQSANNEDVTIGDTTTAIKLNETSPNTANRMVTIKSAVAFGGRTLKIFNYNSGSYLNNLSTTIIDFDGSPVGSLENKTVYLLGSDRSVWRVVSKTKIDEVGEGGPGGGGALYLISIFP